MIRKYTLLCWLLLLVSFGSKAQSIVIGDFGFSGSDFYGPMNTASDTDTWYARYAYIYNEDAIAGLEHGDSIFGLSFFKTGNDKIRYSPNFKIFVRMSIMSDFGTGPLNWTSESKATGMTKVFDADPASVITERAGWTYFPFDNPYVVDTTLGKVHLEVLTEYTQTRKESLIPWVYQNSFYAPAFISNNETKYGAGPGSPVDTIRGSNLRKPYMKIHIPQHDTNLRVNKIYALGEAPILMNTADTIKAWVENEGKKTVYNYPVYVQVTGANRYYDTLIIDSLRPSEERLIYFGNHDTMLRSGQEIINVHFNKDNHPDGDSLKFPRKVNYNIYNHINPNEALGPGGIGFNGRDGDFVAKFYVDSTQYMNQIKVAFGRANSTFKLGVWSMDKFGFPDKELYMSDTLISTIGTNILSLTNKVKIDTAFFVGIRQCGTTNIGFGYQLETPLRPDVFYYTTPAGSTTWVEFDAYANNFVVNIQPRIQVANDVGVLAVRRPNIADTVEYSIDSIAPVATVINYGYADQKIPFDVVCEVVNEYGQTIYKSTKTITIKAEDTLQVTFDSSLNFRYVRNNNIRVYTKLFNDRVRDNDTLNRSYYVGIYHDVYAEGFFSPLDNEQFRLNTDYVKPVTRIVNNGIRDKKDIDVTLQAVKDNKVFYSQTKQLDLDAEGSAIVPFDSFTLSEEGTVMIRVFVHNIIDSFPINDTASINVNVVKSDDIGLLSIIRPKDSSVYHRKDKFTPFVNVRNLGSEDQDSVSIVCTIRDLGGKIWYRDTSTKKYTFFSTTQEIFDEFTVVDSNMTYKVEFVVHNANDQDPSNDTLRATIQGRSKFDLGLERIVRPLAGEKISYLSNGNLPEVVVHNYGTEPIPASNYAWIRVEDVNRGTAYSDSVQIPFQVPGDSTFQLKFDDDLLTNKLGEFEMTFWVSVPGDLEQRNDTLRRRFFVEADYSIGIVEAIVPTDSQRFQQNVSNITPEVKVRNNGLKSLNSETSVLLLVTFNKAIAVRDTVKFESLAAGKDTTLKFDSYLAGLKGEYKWDFALLNGDDQVRTDDSVKGVYFVDKLNDIKAYRLTFPTVDTVLIANDPYEMKAEFINLGDGDQNVNFSVTMQIFDDGSMVYNSNATTKALAGDTFEVSFPAAFIPLAKTTYDYLIFNRLSTDQQHDNDTIGGEFSATWSISVGEIDQSRIVLAPNPSNGVVTVSMDAELIGKKFVVRDAVGRSVYEGELTSTQNTYDLTSAEAGMYYFVILSQKGETAIRFVLNGGE